MATHSSILAWRITWKKELGKLQSIGLQRVGHHWSDLAYMHPGFSSDVLWGLFSSVCCASASFPETASCCLLTWDDLTCLSIFWNNHNRPNWNFTTNNIFQNCKMVSWSPTPNKHSSTVKIFCGNWHLSGFSGTQIACWTAYICVMV